MVREVERILGELSALRRDLEDLRRRLEKESPSLEDSLRRRGFRLGKWNPTEELIFPDDLPPAQIDYLFEMLHRYSFRIFLRDVIAHREALRASQLTKFCSAPTVGEYLDFLEKGRIIETVDPLTYRLAKETVRSFGGTLEWFVAQVFEREFRSPALWGVRLMDLDVGGDYDVLARVEGRLVYLEVKSSPPKHVEQSEVGAFLDRVNQLLPNIALFLVDTELRMKDKVVVMFEEELRRRFGAWARRRHPVKRLFDEVFFLEERVFIVNSKPNLVSNMGRCLRWWFGRQA
ncbi:MAG: hypothetical protein HY998_01330 [candidate division NC10 bacterium]|nr:hypothetical protein [candidate division NC10 bacterium]